MAVTQKKNNSTVMMQSLDPFTVELDGTILIEASAGTGKTYTISLLYLRLLLGIRESNVFTFPLSVEKILVVTFTKAATEELKSRIRANIHELRIECIRHHASPLLTQKSRFTPILDQLVLQNRLAEAIDILLLAEQEMDKASIFTIHGFAQKALNELALESNNLFNLTLLENDSALVRQVVEDFWRTICYQVTERFHHAILNCFKSPSELQGYIKDFLSGNLPEYLDEIVKSQPLNSEQLSANSNNKTSIYTKEQFDQYSTLKEKILFLQENYLSLEVNSVEPLKKAWREAINSPTSELNALIANYSCLNGRSFPAGKIESLVDEMNNWVVSPAIASPPKDIASLGQENLINKTKKNFNPPKMRLFELIDEYLALNLSDFLKANLLKLATLTIGESYSQLKTKEGILTFDDLIFRLDCAIQKDDTHELKRLIQEQYPVALIDEFQDTDFNQFSIFSSLYSSSFQKDHLPLLILIGDPKQAIYSFRGADIYAYMSAKKETTRHYTLDTNYRSSPKVIDSVNALFSAEKSPFLFEEIPFLKVKKAKENNNLEFVVEGESQPGLGLLVSDELLSLNEYKQEMSEKVANIIANWLNLAREGKAYFIDKNGLTKNLDVSDICIIVRSKPESDYINESLSKRGIQSVYLSGETSVFKTDLAIDVLRLLKAINMPSNDKLLLEAYGSGLFQKNAKEIFELRENDEFLEALMVKFKGYHDKWLQNGIMAVLRAILLDYDLAKAWQAAGLGERILLDYLHLAELLQSIESNFESGFELINWLVEQTQKTTLAKDDFQLRLESNKNLIKIITIHKSKGLEFPIVVHPFAMLFHSLDSGDKAKILAYVHEDLHMKVTDVSVEPSKQKSQAIEYELLTENIRLSYVALTRAKYHCVIGLSHLMKAKNSKEDKAITFSTSVGHLLLNGHKMASNTEDKECALPRFNECIESLILRSKEGESTSIELINNIKYTELKSLDAESPLNEKLVLKQFTRQLKENWRISSYSSLIYLSKTTQTTYEPKITHKFEELLGNEIRNIENGLEHTDDILLNKNQQLNAFSFPRGSRPGIFLHSLLEDLEKYLGDDDSHQIAWQAIFEEFNHYFSKHNPSQLIDLNVWQKPLYEWLLSIYNYQLPVAHVALSAIPKAHQLKELHFHLSIRKSVSSKELNYLLNSYDQLSSKSKELNFADVEGMLQGFIDLVFVHNNKYYIVDYKSNYLGDDINDYNQEALEQAMILHRYDLQYQLYTLALHRFLRHRLSAYDYDTHFGGVYYLFIRALDKNIQLDSSPIPLNSGTMETIVSCEQITKKEEFCSGIFYNKPKKELIEGLDKLFSGR
ncbi:exodeoxyribonuclease V subunit beta [Thorsellia kenyensis]|uniref:RecBCD enzyme subunit RecB n=1 Tax=Thorsellia kenyensis TaxID=1549888 RepID=A0ABV6CA01_9GAMM